MQAKKRVPKSARSSNSSSSSGSAFKNKTDTKSLEDSYSLLPSTQTLEKCDSSSSSTLNWALSEEEHPQVDIAKKPVKAIGKPSLLGNCVESKKAQSERTIIAHAASSIANAAHHQNTNSTILLSCSSEDSSSSSLIYSLGDTGHSVNTSVSGTDGDLHSTKLGVLDDTVSRLTGLLLPVGHYLIDGTIGYSIDEEDDAMVDDDADAMVDDIDDIDVAIDKLIPTKINDIADGHSHNDPAADLVASTLAECRLLLEMSPPPTPMSNAYWKEMQQQEKEEQLQKQAKEEEQQQQQERRLAQERIEIQLEPRASTQLVQYQDTVQASPKSQSSETRIELHRQTTTPTARINQTRFSTNSNISHPEQAPLMTTTPPEEGNSITSLTSYSIAQLSSISNFLTCSSCTTEFSQEHLNSNHEPLHSFACDHINY